MKSGSLHLDGMLEILEYDGNIYHFLAICNAQSAARHPFCYITYVTAIHGFLIQFNFYQTDRKLHQRQGAHAYGPPTET